jgi:hypothetical protein
MSKRVSNKRGAPAGARSYATGYRGRDKAYKARQRSLAEARALNPEPTPVRTPSKRISVWARLRRAVRQWWRGLWPS